MNRIEFTRQISSGVSPHTSNVNVIEISAVASDPSSLMCFIKDILKRTWFLTIEHFVKVMSQVFVVSFPLL